MSDEERQKLERRSFLEQCGRFAVVTPPVVSLMLTTGTRAALAASGKTTLTTTATTTATATATATATTTTSTTATATSDVTITSDTTTTTTATVTVTDTLNTNDVNAMMIRPDSSGPSELAMMIDSMGVMKLT